MTYYYFVFVFLFAFGFILHIVLDGDGEMVECECECEIVLCSVKMHGLAYLILRNRCVIITIVIIFHLLCGFSGQ